MDFVNDIKQFRPHRARLTLTDSWSDAYILCTYYVAKQYHALEQQQISQGSSSDADMTGSQCNSTCATLWLNTCVEAKRPD